MRVFLSEGSKTEWAWSAADSQNHKLLEFNSIQMQYSGLPGLSVPSFLLHVNNNCNYLYIKTISPEQCYNLLKICITNNTVVAVS